MSLIFAVSILGGISISGATAIQFVSSNELAAERSYVESEAQVTADAGHNIARAILWDPDTNLTDPSAIPLMTTTIDGKQVSYSGSYDSLSQIWTLSGTASFPNPNAGGAPIVKTVSSKVQVTPGATVPDPNTQAAWSTIYVDDWTDCAKIEHNFVVRVEMYVRGDLCMEDDAVIDAEAGIVQVWGNIDIEDDATIGTSGDPLQYLAVSGGCRDENPTSSNSPPRPFNNPCDGGDSTYVTTFSDSPEDITMPPMDLPYWYANAKPGPMHPCTSGSLPSGEEFDDDTTINESANTFELTTAAAYDCQYWEGGEMIGRIAYSGDLNGTLTVLGTIFFDGDIHLRDGDGVRAQYDGQATLYSSEEIEVEDDVWLCGVFACDETWDPTTNMLVLVADGDGTSDGIDVEEDAKFQGAAFSLTELDISKNGEFWGSAITRRIEFKRDSTIRPLPGGIMPILPGMPQTTITAPALTDISASYTIS